MTENQFVFVKLFEDIFYPDVFLGGYNNAENPILEYRRLLENGILSTKKRNNVVRINGTMSSVAYLSLNYPILSEPILSKPNLSNLTFPKLP